MCADTDEVLAGILRAGNAGANTAIDHVQLGTGVQVAAKSAVMGDIDAGTVVGGIPATDLGHYRRQAAVSSVCFSTVSLASRSGACRCENSASGCSGAGSPG